MNTVVFAVSIGLGLLLSSAGPVGSLSAPGSGAEAGVLLAEGSDFSGGTGFGGGIGFGSGTGSSFRYTTPGFAYPAAGYGYGAPGMVRYPGVPGYPYGYGYGYPVPGAPGVRMVGPGYGMSPAYPGALPGAMTYAAPVPIAGGTFRIGNCPVRYWLAPSGYYYPWYGGAGYPYSSTVYYVQQGSTAPAKPPVSAQLNDMEKFLDEQQSKGKIAQTNYEHLSRRLNDLRGKYYSLSGASGGNLDPQDEDSLRRELDMLGEEISRDLQPMPAPAE